jgi:5-methylcytosine-specific restriction endonuclease McrA
LGNKVDDAKRNRRRLVDAFGLACWYCGLDLAFREYHVDHILPKSNGGTDKLSNLAIACTFCNYAKSGRPLDEFYAWMAYISGRKFNPIIRPGEPHPLKNNHGPKLPGL